MRAKSLARRIFFASCLLMPLLLGFSAFMLDRAFRSSLYNAEKESLLAQSYSMMGLAEPLEARLNLPQNLSDPRFNTPDSGLYAQVVDAQNTPIWQSVSLSISALDGRIPLHEVNAGELDFSTEKINGETFFVSRFTTVWELAGSDQRFQFVIVHTQTPIKQEIRRYRNTLVIWLGGLALLLILIQSIIIQWGLFPLKRLAGDIKKLESGAIDSLDDGYPSEILPVTNNINLLLQSEQKQRKRYKNTLADLAHSLKTPLSVIRSIVEKTDNEFHMETQNWRESVDEQVTRMNNIVVHQLNRATPTRTYFQSTISIKPLIKRVADALGKVYRDKNIVTKIEVAPELALAVEENDLMEVLGNLLENAYKYGEKCVNVHAKKSMGIIEIIIEDDGPGVPTGLRNEILQRGARADTSAPGQGIGLAVVADIVSSYDGGIQVERSPSLGGARFCLSLPC